MKLINRFRSFSSVCLLAGGVLVAGCSDFLSEELYIRYSEEETFSNVELVESASLGIYDEVSNMEMYGRDIPYLEATTDIDLYYSAAATSSTNDAGQIANFNINVKNTYIENFWKHYYAAINRANLVIVNAASCKTNSEEEEFRLRMYLAEAKTLRAFFYLELVKRWGDVPLMLEPGTLSDLFHARTPRYEVYAQMIKDLEEAIPDLPWFDEEAYEKGHMHKGAAMGILARVCLFAGGYSLNMNGEMTRPENYKEYYQKVVDVTGELVTSGKHRLNPDYKDIFYKICQNELEPSESLFEIPLAYLKGQNRHMSTIGTLAFGLKISGYSSTFDCNSRMNTHEYARSKFCEGDLRRDISIADYSLSGVNFEHRPITDAGAFMYAKWRRDWHKAEPESRLATDINNVILRYAEVLLMRAEALNELSIGGVDREAVELVNKVRRRGYGVDVDVPNAVADVPVEQCSDKTVFFNFLTEEYARELLGEGGRRFHLIRWNLLKDKLAAISVIFEDENERKKYFGNRYSFMAGRCFVHGKHELYPIPYREMVENKGWTNNPGYTD